MDYWLTASSKFAAHCYCLHLLETNSSCIFSHFKHKLFFWPSYLRFPSVLLFIKHVVVMSHQSMFSFFSGFSKFSFFHVLVQELYIIFNFVCLKYSSFSFCTTYQMCLYMFVFLVNSSSRIVKYKIITLKILNKARQSNVQ